MFPSEDKRRNAFEDHIQGEGFDVSQLGTPNPFVHIRERVNTLLNSLPQPLDYRLYEEELDETQKQLCAYVAEAVAERYIKPTLSEQQPGEVSDDDLHMVVTITVAMAMIAQQRLYIPTSAAQARPALKPIMPVEVPPPPKPAVRRSWWARFKRRAARLILRLLRQN
jgi:hypothetical protein